MKIAYIGAGSIQFGPLIIQDILMSDLLCKERLEIHLMDIERSHLTEVIKHGNYVNQKLNRQAKILVLPTLKKP